MDLTNTLSHKYSHAKIYRTEPYTQEEANEIELLGQKDFNIINDIYNKKLLIENDFHKNIVIHNVYNFPTFSQQFINKYIEDEFNWTKLLSKEFINQLKKINKLILK